MPQELHVLRCYNCATFQVHIVKKVNKWQCKICNEKQSVKQVFGRGTGKDCREHVQKLNALRASEHCDVPAEHCDVPAKHRDVPADVNTVPCEATGSSKWHQYLDKEPDRCEVSDDEDITTVPTNQRKTFTRQRNVAKRAKLTDGGFHRQGEGLEESSDDKATSRECFVSDHDDSAANLTAKKLAGVGKWGKYMDDREVGEEEEGTVESGGKWGKYIDAREVGEEEEETKESGGKWGKYLNDREVGEEEEGTEESGGKWGKYLNDREVGEEKEEEEVFTGGKWDKFPERGSGIRDASEHGLFPSNDSDNDLDELLKL